MPDAGSLCSHHLDPATLLAAQVTGHEGRRKNDLSLFVPEVRELQHAMAEQHEPMLSNI